MGHLQTAAWWENEAPVFDPDAIDFLPLEIQIDTVVSHAAPSFCKLNEHNYLHSWAAYDPNLLDDVTAERKTMDQVHERLINDEHPVRQWFYGHFHQSWCSEIDSIRYSMLDIMEFKEVRANL